MQIFLEMKKMKTYQKIANLGNKTSDIIGGINFSYSPNDILKITSYDSFC